MLDCCLSRRNSSQVLIWVDCCNDFLLLAVQLGYRTSWNSSVKVNLKSFLDHVVLAPESLLVSATGTWGFGSSIWIRKGRLRLWLESMKAKVCRAAESSMEDCASRSSWFNTASTWRQVQRQRFPQEKLECVIRHPLPHQTSWSRWSASPVSVGSDLSCVFWLVIGPPVALPSTGQMGFITEIFIYITVNWLCL